MRNHFKEVHVLPPRFSHERPRVISPPKSDLNSLRQPLTVGEKQVLEFFDRNLPAGWEIYIQPHLNGLRPDFVLLHPEKGIAVYEVKDWSLDAIKYWVEVREGGAPELMAKKDGKLFSLQKENPIEKVHRYREEIRDLYCPRLEQKNSVAVVTAGVIFTAADDNRVASLFALSRDFHNMQQWSQYNPICGREALLRDDLSYVFPEATRGKSIYMNPELADDLRSWLIEPDFQKEQRVPLALDSEQKKWAETRTKSGYRRITGPAGSGKSVVLAARAAKLVAEGKDVLIVAFNITLLNYLADSAVRNNSSARKNATWLHFHRWCRRVCEEAGKINEYKAIYKKTGREDEDGVPDDNLCRLVESVLDNTEDSSILRYDAILVDEGQDILPEWWRLLRKALRQGGEMLLAADATQDVYGRAGRWTEGAMKGAGFSGEWVNLGVSYRMPPKLIELVRSFGERFLPKIGRDLPPSSQMELDMWPCQLRWVHVAPGQVASACFEEYKQMMRVQGDDGVSVSDVTLLVDTLELGGEVVAQFERNGFNCSSTFAQDSRQQRRQKLGFFMGDARIKATTLHSFKGWESRALLICLEQKMDQRSLSAVYAGLTRLKRDERGSFLTVVCVEQEIASFGKSWPEFLDQSHWVPPHPLEPYFDPIFDY